MYIFKYILITLANNKLLCA